MQPSHEKSFTLLHATFANCPVALDPYPLDDVSSYRNLVVDSVSVSIDPKQAASSSRSRSFTTVGAPIEDVLSEDHAGHAVVLEEESSPIGMRPREGAHRSAVQRLEDIVPEKKNWAVAVRKWNPEVYNQFDCCAALLLFLGQFVLWVIWERMQLGEDHKELYRDLNIVNFGFLLPALYVIYAWFLQFFLCLRQSFSLAKGTQKNINFFCGKYLLHIRLNVVRGGGGGWRGGGAAIVCGEGEVGVEVLR